MKLTRNQIIGLVIVAAALLILFIWKPWKTKNGTGATATGTNGGTGTGNADTGRFAGAGDTVIGDDNQRGFRPANRQSLINQIQTLSRTRLNRDLTSAELTRLNGATITQLQTFLPALQNEVNSSSARGGGVSPSTAKAGCSLFCCSWLFGSSCCNVDCYPGGGSGM